MADIPLPMSPVLGAQDPPHLIIDDDEPGLEDIELPALSIPHLIKLKGDENLMEWKESVRGAFSTNRLLRFINNDPKTPTANTSLKVRVKYLRDRGKAHQLIRASVEPIIDILQSYGWKDGDDRPQALYDLAVKAVSRVTDEAWCNTLDELMSLDASRFDSLRSYLTQYNTCLKKLNDVGITFCSKAKQGMIIRALKQYDETWVNFLKYQLHSGDLTYDKLLTQVQARANEQSFNNNPVITTKQDQRKDGKDSKDSTGIRSVGKNTAGNVDCGESRCKMNHKRMPIHPFHQRCGAHHPNGDDACWALHPELKTGWEARNKNNNNGNPNGTNNGGANAPNRTVLTFDSNVITGVNNNRSNNNNYLAVDVKHIMTTFNPESFEDDNEALSVEEEDPVEDSTINQAMAVPTTINKLTRDTVCADSGAESNLFNNVKWFNEVVELRNPIKITSATGGLDNLTHGGPVTLKCDRDDGALVNLIINNATFSAKTPMNLVSVGQLRNRGIIFDGYRDVLIHVNSGQVVARIIWVNNVATISLDELPRNCGDDVVLVAIEKVAMVAIDYVTMHRRLMHVNPEKVIETCEKHGITIDKKEARDHKCHWCHLGKSTRVISREAMPRTDVPLQRVHIDSNPHKPTSVDEKNHAIHITDEASRYRWYIAIGKKSEGFDAVTRWVLFIETQTDLKVQEIHIDNGTEFSIERLKQWCLERGKKLTTIAPDCPS